MLIETAKHTNDMNSFAARRHKRRKSLTADDVDDADLFFTETPRADFPPTSDL